MFDFFIEGTGEAISAKTLNTLTPARLANPEQIYRTVAVYIDKVGEFTNARLLDRRLTSNLINIRTLDIAIPLKTTEAQIQQLLRAVDYGKLNDVVVKLSKVK
jgi:filamentous hemagglutinin